MVIELRAHDPDEGEAGRLSYQMEALFDERSNGYFLIDSDTGLVSTARALDRETKDTHVLKVSAVDHGSPRRSAATYLTVTVSDTNDHSPVFEQSEYRERVRENLEVGYEVLTIRATDGDAPSNANMRYRLLEGAGGVFEIDERSGVVRTRAVVDREEEASYQLLVEANDQGRNPGPLSATATVHIVVEDENDNYPQFSEKRYVVQVPEDVAVNTPVLRVQATDRDQGQNAAIHYSIIIVLTGPSPLTGLGRKRREIRMVEHELVCLCVECVGVVCVHVGVGVGGEVSRTRREYFLITVTVCACVWACVWA